MQSKNKWWGVLYSFLFIIIVWYILYLILHRPIVPSPAAVFINLGHIFAGKIQIHLLYSLSRILCGLAISILIGVPLGFLMGYVAKIDNIMSPLLYFSYPVPKVALLPIIMLLFGLGETSKLIMIVMIIIFQIIITARDAVKSIPPETFRSLQSLGAGSRQIFQEIIFPAALPEILTSSRLAVGTAASVLFFTETYGTEYGMGYFIMDSWMRVNYLDMYAGIAALSILGFIIFCAIDITEQRVCSWQSVNSQMANGGH